MRDYSLGSYADLHLLFLYQVEMEHKRETDIEDYWLIQYQRLLESKPRTLLEKVDFVCKVCFKPMYLKALSPGLSLAADLGLSIEG